MRPRVIKKVMTPHDCYIILTAKCNQRCLHCYGNYGMDVPQNELTGKEWDKVFEDLVKHNVFYINISGGEPTVHPDFLEILKSLKKHKLHFIITTNGLFTEKIFKAIVDVKDLLIGIKISLDGPDYISNGYIRRNVKKEISESDFNRTLKNLRMLKEKDIPFTIATCIHKGNIDRMNDLLDLILELKPVSWFISTISTSGRSFDNLNIFASDSEIEKKRWNNIKNICNKNDIFVNFIDMPFATATKKTEKFYYQCPAARSFCEINSDGLVSPCPLARVNIPSEFLKFENVRDKSIKDIWNGKAFNRFLELSKGGCKGCEAKDKCDRCIPQSILWFSDPTLPPPHCIQNGESLGLENIKDLRTQLKKRMEEYQRDNYIDVEKK
ncbi:MAG: Radical SAM domain protein [candidate division WS6 bacterium GW2011_GWF2_33_92]|uniref:Radical SAM domain protein n=1 Tax=candidate division WS6 bacterium GW2011_GWB1_33_6 TaxID=1619088 RepID=A0A0G0AUF1_9BACT|nr:MAG: Radical SAM domain protein [candidate division WS6 bacterium GW2011_GWB1_33_6]KKP56493.1 MAG: Radical SAM domain protein [candidate division WS6 bacterium GW2011_GWF2_33_92]